ncbi:hypothetical protein GCM10010289_01200 [Streptomyces violascens]|nr:hypothetical protein GCM10010289_01200 [Streptomyces violascens]
MAAWGEVQPTAATTAATTKVSSPAVRRSILSGRGTAAYKGGGLCMWTMPLPA